MLVMAQITVTVTAAASLAGVSRTTIRRWFHLGDGGRVDLEQLAPRMTVLLSAEDMATVAHADRGDPDAEAEVAQMLREADRHVESVWWLQRAATGGNADAMHWLARAYMDGKGIQRDEYAGLMWLAKSAAAGHAVSRAQVDKLLSGRRPVRR